MFTGTVCPIHATEFSVYLGLKAAFSSESHFRDGPMNFLPRAFPGSFSDRCGEEPRVVVASFKARFGLSFKLLSASSKGGLTL